MESALKCSSSVLRRARRREPSDWVAGAVGANHSLAIRADGSLWTWGRNNNGQLGLGDITSRLAPAPVGSDSNWVAVAAGQFHSLGLRADGSLWAWGWNAYGQLGVADTRDRKTPTRVPFPGALPWIHLLLLGN